MRKDARVHATVAGQLCSLHYFFVRRNPRIDWDSCQKEPFVFYKDKLQILQRQGARRNVVIRTTFFSVLRDESKFMENCLATHHPVFPVSRSCSSQRIKVGNTRPPLCIPLANLFVVFHVDYLSDETLYRIGNLVVLGKTNGSRYVSSIRSEQPVIFITITNSTSLFAVDW